MQPSLELWAQTFCLRSDLVNGEDSDKDDEDDTGKDDACTAKGCGNFFPVKIMDECKLCHHD